MATAARKYRPSDIYIYGRSTVETHLAGMGYKMVAFRVPKVGEWYFTPGAAIVIASAAEVRINGNLPRLILKKVPSDN